MHIVEEKKGQFYLGKNLKTQTPLHYRSKDLTTHAAIIGMTGSGKTGLGIALLEEAALANTPIIAIDPKGDMTNLALAFETMSAEEYLQWIDPSEASMQNKSVDELAQERSTTNLKGLAESLQDPTRLKRYRAVEKIIYTPGSSAGVGVDILGSFTAPPQETLDDTRVSLLILMPVSLHCLHFLVRRVKMLPQKSTSSSPHSCNTTIHKTSHLT